MSKNMIYVMMFAFLSQGALAHEMCEGKKEHKHKHKRDGAMVFPGVLSDRPEPKEGPCADLKLTKDEKAKIKDAYFKYKEARIDLKANAEKARLNEKKVSSNPTSDFAAVDEADKAKIDASAKLKSAKDGYRNDVLFNILKTDQRSNARACWRAERSHGKHRFDRERAFFKRKKEKEGKKS